MGAFVAPSDLAPFATIDAAKASAMVEDAESVALMIAPCLSELAVDDPKRGAVKAILRGAILRWEDAGSGALQTQQEQIGPFGAQATVTPLRKSMFWPSEIEQLQSLCAATRNGAFEVDTAPAGSGVA